MDIKVLKNQLSETRKLWRYVNLHKFIAMFESENLYFNRLDFCDDIFEGVSYELAKAHLISKSLSNEDEINPHLPEEMKENIIREYRQAKIDFAEGILIEQEKRFVSSWINSDRESIAMWEIYSDRNSVAICVDGLKFISTIKGVLDLHTEFYKKCILFCGPVKYLPIYPFGPETVEAISKDNGEVYTGFVKDSTYEHEHEFRFLILDTEGQAKGETNIQMPLSVDFPSLITVYAHPKMPDWEFENIKKLCAKYKLTEPKRSDILLKK